MTEKQLVVIVLGYGCHLTLKMQQYLDSVIAFVNDNKTTAIILSGGFTNRKTAPGISEAKMMNNYLENKTNVPIILEESATTTAENLTKGRLILSIKELLDCHLIIFCDQSRQLKIKLLCRLLLGFWPEIRSFDLSAKLATKALQLFVATPLDILALWIPCLEKLKYKRLEHKMNNS